LPDNVKTAKVIGGGLAGAEAAFYLARRGVETVLYEMKPARFSPAHKSVGLAELVCSNSFKAMRLQSAAGLLKAEMEILGSLTVFCAKKSSVPAGGALAVDRDEFSRLVTEAVEKEPNITVVREEIKEIPESGETCAVIIATGPLTSKCLAEKIRSLCFGLLHFFDAAAPIITKDSIEMEKAFFASRYGRGGENDYINCPMDRETYENFYNELINAETAELHAFEKNIQEGSLKNFYEGCIPIEVMAKRGADTIRFGPMKPVGLTDPATGRRPWANLQLRMENAAGTLYNLVGFQTNLKFAEQKRVFSLIPALKNAEFARYGVMHRNTFLDSPRLLTPGFMFKTRPGLFFAGQITGVEGYMESAASGILAGIGAGRFLDGLPPVNLPQTTMTGALSLYVSGETAAPGAAGTKNFQPMGASFGLLEPLAQKVKKKDEKYLMLAERSLEIIKQTQTLYDL